VRPGGTRSEHAAAAPAGEEKIIVVPTYQGALTNHFVMPKR
jgi:hypothetical protein